jgi:hypothetical protein
LGQTGLDWSEVSAVSGLRVVVSATILVAAAAAAAEEEERRRIWRGGLMHRRLGFGFRGFSSQG